MSFEASLKVVEEEEEEEVVEVLEEYDETEYEEHEGEYKEFFTYDDEEEWDWRSRAGDLASEKDENWDD